MPTRGFSTVLAERRSQRSLQRPNLRDVLDVVAAATLVHSAERDDPTGRLRTASASAGALHPVSVVVVRPFSTPLPFHVDPMSGCLRSLRVTDGRSFAAQVRDLISTLSDDCRPTYLALLGDMARVEGAYANPGSLLWRDAGALLATLHLCAVASGLAFCPLGPLGEGFARGLFPNEPRIVACGTAAIGVRTDA